MAVAPTDYAAALDLLRRAEEEEQLARDREALSAPLPSVPDVVLPEPGAAPAPSYVDTPDLVAPFLTEQLGPVGEEAPAQAPQRPDVLRSLLPDREAAAESPAATAGSLAAPRVRPRDTAADALEQAQRTAGTKKDIADIYDLYSRMNQTISGAPASQTFAASLRRQADADVEATKERLATAAQEEERRRAEAEKAALQDPNSPQSIRRRAVMKALGIGVPEDLAAADVGEVPAGPALLQQQGRREQLEAQQNMQRLGAEERQKAAETEWARRMQLEEYRAKQKALLEKIKARRRAKGKGKGSKDFSDDELKTLAAGDPILYKAIQSSEDARDKALDRYAKTVQREEEKKRQADKIKFPGYRRTEDAPLLSSSEEKELRAAAVSAKQIGGIASQLKKIRKGLLPDSDDTLGDLLVKAAKFGAPTSWVPSKQEAATIRADLVLTWQSEQIKGAATDAEKEIIEENFAKPVDAIGATMIVYDTIAKIAQRNLRNKLESAGYEKIGPRGSKSTGKKAEPVRAVYLPQLDQTRVEFSDGSQKFYKGKVGGR